MSLPALWVQMLLLKLCNLKWWIAALTKWLQVITDADSSYCSSTWGRVESCVALSRTPVSFGDLQQPATLWMDEFMTKLLLLGLFYYGSNPAAYILVYVN